MKAKNIMFQLTPKAEVTYLFDDDTIGEALEKLKEKRYSSVPIVCRQTGTYMGTITEGDILWELCTHKAGDFEDTCAQRVCNVKRYRDNEPVDVNTNMEDLVAKVSNQNFVPVIDSMNCFIGIVTRRAVIAYLKEHQGQ